VNSSFQNSLKQLTFKTIYQGQVETFDYDKLFADQRVIIFSTPSLFLEDSYKHLEQYKSSYTDFTNNTINNVYVVNSFNPMVSGIVDAMFNPIIGLIDNNQEFVSALAKEIESPKDINFLARRWEYVAIINNGQLEKFWQNMFPETISLRRYRYGYENKYQKSEWELHGKIQQIGSIHYRKLGANVVLDYLKNSVDSNT
jgi:peroxiredoxin